jgi:hypothetical protein
VLVAELDRRRHEALDVRLQLRRHPLVVAVVVGAAATLLAAAILASAARRRRAQAKTTRAQNLVQSMLVLSKSDPERLAAAIDGTRTAKESALSQVAKLAGLAVRPLISRSLGPPARPA